MGFDLTVTRYVKREAVGDFVSYGSTVYEFIDADRPPEVYETMSRAFHCSLCGDMLIDGDRYIESEKHGPVHSVCYQGE